MRKMLFALALVFAAQIPLGVTMAPAQEGTARQIALNEHRAPLGDRIKKILHPKDSTFAFCGQCTKDADCGVGYKCAGRPNCMECRKK